VSKARRDIRLQVADVSTPVNKMRRPDADQPLEDSTTQQCPTVFDNLKLLVISSVSDVKEVPEETVHIVAAQQLIDCGHVNP